MYTFDPVQPSKKSLKAQNHYDIHASECMQTSHHSYTSEISLQALTAPQVFSVYSGRSKLRSKLDRNKLGTNHEPTYQ